MLINTTVQPKLGHSACGAHPLVPRRNQSFPSRLIGLPWAYIRFSLTVNLHLASTALLRRQVPRVPMVPARRSRTTYLTSESRANERGLDTKLYGEPFLKREPQFDRFVAPVFSRAPILLTR